MGFDSKLTNVYRKQMIKYGSTIFTPPPKQKKKEKKENDHKLWEWKGHMRNDPLYSFFLHTQLTASRAVYGAG